MAINTLILGSGGREHALAWRCRQSPLCGRLLVSPGNPAITTMPQTLSTDDWSPTADKIDLVICGPEQAIADGIAERLLNLGLKVFAPNKLCARLESSKRYAKEIMKQAGIATADYQLSTDRQTTEKLALEFLAKQGGVVLKASGLAAGKGVFVCRTAQQITDALTMLYSDRWSKASAEIIVEEIIEGRECSFFALLGNDRPFHLGFAVDYKRLYDGDRGPNTGGMGSYCPVPWLPDDAEQQVIDQIVKPLQPQLKNYVGCLYLGLMWTDRGPKVLEFNVRFGDPETQALVVANDCDWLSIIAGQAGHDIDLPLAPSKTKPTVAVVLSAPGYPYNKDNNPTKLARSLLASDNPDCQVFGASLERVDDRYLQTGNGRVLTVVARGQSHDEARRRVYGKVEKIADSWRQAHFRTDIGEKIL